jgi:hypothetical protein
MISKKLGVTGMHPAAGRFAMCAASERASLQSAAPTNARKEDGQSDPIQTSARPQKESSQLPNAIILDHSIRPDSSISYLAELLI